MTKSNTKNRPEGEARLWYSRPLRILQTVLREVDAAGYDAGAVVDFMLRDGYDVLVVNGGGIFDFFRSPLEFANPVSQMGDRDILAEISHACREAGIRVIARVDFRGVHEEQYRRHPDWFGCDERGNPLVRPTQSVRLYGPCYNSYYRNEYAVQFLRYLLSNYEIDGVWHNAVLIGERCFCRRCREAYRAERGHDIPSLSNESAAAAKEYELWNSEHARKNLRMLRETCKSFSEEKAYVAEVFSMFDVKRPRETGLDLYDIRDIFDFLVSVGFLTENRPNPRYTNLTYPLSIVKLLKEIHPKKQPVVLFGGNGTSYRFVADPPSDLAVWAYETVSAGGSYWNCLFNGMHPAATHDRRNAHFLSETNTFLRQHADLLAETLPENEVALFYSKQTKDRVGSDDPGDDEYNTALQGVERVLLESHFQYSFITEESLSPERLSEVRVLIMPNVACLSEEACGVITNWVEKGGRLIATFMTSLFTEEGAPRADFGLSRLFGCSYGARREDTSYDCYQHIASPDHALFAGMSDTEVLRTGPLTLSCRPAASGGPRILAHQVPIIKNQPPERAWRTPMQSAEPAIVENKLGAGRVLYFASQIDRAVMLDGHSDFRDLLRNGVADLLGPERVVTTNAPESLIVTRLRSAAQPGSWLLSFVNITSSPVRPLRSIIPLQEVSISVLPGSGASASHPGPSGKPAFRYTAFGKGGEKVEVRESAGAISIRIPAIQEFLSLRFDPAE